MTAKNKKKLKEKKRNFFKKLKKRLEADEDIDDETAKEYAEQWFGLADIDGNGLIDMDEFLEFIEKLDENKSLDKEEITKQFENHDSNNQKALD